MLAYVSRKNGVKVYFDSEEEEEEDERERERKHLNERRKRRENYIKPSATQFKHHFLFPVDGLKILDEIARELFFDYPSIITMNTI